MNHREDGFFLPENASKARIREAENARRNRAEILKAHSQGQVSRRDLIKMGSHHNRRSFGANPRPQPVRQQRLWQHSHGRKPQPAVWRATFHPGHGAL